MTIAFTDGRQTTTSSEVTMVDYSGLDQHYAMWLFLHNMTSSETFRFKVYTTDQNSSTLRQYLEVNKTGVQSPSAFFIPYVSTKEFKVTVQRTAGSDQSVTWQVIEIS